MTLEEIDTIDDKNGLILDMSKQNEKLMQDPMVRIADALEEILRLVKADQERSQKYMEEKKNEQAPRITYGPGLPGPLALAPGPRTKLQAASGKLQAPSFRVDKIKL